VRKFGHRTYQSCSLSQCGNLELPWSFLIDVIDEPELRPPRANELAHGLDLDAEGSTGSERNGKIPLAVEQAFRSALDLEASYRSGK
jgi:hypothetical protein